ncbi:MAG: hypothetical protein QCI38_02370 [Candidatus Thermoplasmatota archaeon]|nr:hypothetical protein [Candidatus Thermoplasmatota archaeon]
MPERKEPMDSKKLLIDSLVEGRKMEAYAEHRAKEMHSCWLCGEIIYRKRPIKKVGERWICIDCLRSLREALDTMDEWEREIALGEKMKKQISHDLKVEKG